MVKIEHVSKYLFPSTIFFILYMTWNSLVYIKQNIIFLISMWNSLLIHHITLANVSQTTNKISGILKDENLCSLHEILVALWTNGLSYRFVALHDACYLKSKEVQIAFSISKTRLIPNIYLVLFLLQEMSSINRQTYSRNKIRFTS